MRARNHLSSPSVAIAHVICWKTESRSVLENRRTTTASAPGLASITSTMASDMNELFVEPRPLKSQQCVYPCAMTSPSTSWNRGMMSEEASTIGDARPSEAELRLHRLHGYAQHDLWHGLGSLLVAPAVGLTVLVEALALEQPRCGGPVLVAWQRGGADRGEQRLLERRLLLFSPSLNSRCSLFLGSPIQR